VERWNPPLTEYPPLNVAEIGAEGRGDTSGSEEKIPAPLRSINMKAENIDSYMDKVHTSANT
jgi:hypothetical protein